MEELVTTIEDALAVQGKIGYPCEISPSFSLYGHDSRIAYNKKGFIRICIRGLKMSPVSEIMIRRRSWSSLEYGDILKGVFK